MGSIPSIFPAILPTKTWNKFKSKPIKLARYTLGRVEFLRLPFRVCLVGVALLRARTIQTRHTAPNIFKHRM